MNGFARWRWSSAAVRTLDTRPRANAAIRAAIGAVVCALLIGPTGGVASAWGAGPSAPLSSISSDPFTDSGSQHQTAVEPDSFAYGQTVVAASMSGRYFSGGGANGLGWATSSDDGVTWAQGLLPNLTTSNGGPFDRVTDPVVAYDAVHQTWLISASAVIFGATSVRTFVTVSRSHDGLHWSDPNIVEERDNDKEWIVCDNGPLSPFRGTCYLEWTTFSPNHIELSVSRDGGATWGPVQVPGKPRAEIAGQPLVQPNGTVIMPMVDWSADNSVQVMRSVDGGATWKGEQTGVRIKHRDTPYIRGGASQFVSAEIDGSGNIFVAWSDCRFRKNCSSNDIVFATTADGVHWSLVQRVPIDGLASGLDHLIPGIGVDVATSGGATHVGLAFYQVQAGCAFADCRLQAGFVSSVDGGAHWSAPTPLGSQMRLDWIADTNRGRFVGDYISTSFTNGGRAHPVVSIGLEPAGSEFNQSIFTPTGWLSVN